MGNVIYVIEVGVLQTQGLSFLMHFLVDKKTTEQRMKNFKLSGEKVEQRMKMEERGDFWDRIQIKSSNDNEKGEGMSKAEMQTNASVLVLGGSETSATALSGTIYLLCNHPEVKKRLEDEVRFNFHSTEEIDLHSVNRLPYLAAVLDEAVRIYPPVPFQSQRETPRGGAEVRGQQLPGGVIVSVPQLATYRSAENFYRPLEFLPERWLPDAPKEFQNDDKAAFQPFSQGEYNVPQARFDVQIY
jgi:cytochrome P450